MAGLHPEAQSDSLQRHHLPGGLGLHALRFCGRTHSLDKKLRLELNQRTNLELFACAESNQLVADATVTMLLALGLPRSLAALAPLQPLLGGSIERMIAEYSFNQW